MENKKKVAFYTLGCKLNFSETSTIARNFQEEGFDRVDFEEVADMYVINTCSVTENADKQFKQIVKKAMKLNDKAFIAAVGCYAQLKPEELASVDGVDLVLGATEKFKITDYINDLTKNERSELHSCEIEEADFYVGSYSIGDRTRAFLKVQDGCDYKCTYCTIPLARGISRSDALENVLKNASEISKQNIKEIVLTGVNIGDYGKGEFGNKKHEHTFLDLVKALDEVEGIERLRISSIEPNLLKNETIEFVSQSRTFVPHFHIPLQSGSNKILKLMRRRYLSELFASRIEKIKSVMPHACIGADVIVGFPDESENDFNETLEFIHSLPISYLHVFTYSERLNTLAASLPNAVPMHIRKQRNQTLRNLSLKLMHHFRSQFENTTRKVLFESENKNGMMEGYSDNYLRISLPFDESMINKIIPIKIQEQKMSNTQSEVLA